MNTVEIGDNFEAKSKKLIEQIIDNHELSVNPAHCKVYEKKKYYSIKRKKEIIFDLSIEVTPLKAKRPFLVCIIECKNLNKPVPVDDIEEFDSKVDGIQEFQTKKIIIAKNGFQSGTLETAKSLGVTLIDVNEDEYNIILYKPDRKDKDTKNEKISLDTEIENLIKKSLLPENIKGLKKLSAKAINNIAMDFLDEVDKNITKRAWKTPIEAVIKFLENEKGIKTNFNNFLFDKKGNKQLGYYDLKNKTIYINKDIIKTISFPFVFGHELGHYILHSNLKTHQSTYDNFKDSEHNFFLQKNILKNDKHWVEWQANCFASCFLMPEKTILTRLISIQMSLGISKQGTIYLDNQEVNRKDYRKIIESLSSFFDVSKISVEYRLENLNIIKKSTNNKDTEEEKEFLRRISIMKSKFI